MAGREEYFPRPDGVGLVEQGRQCAPGLTMISTTAECSESEE
jgi:hypothetical protein